MAATFPTSPTDGQTTTVNNILYVYSSATRSWARVPSNVAVGGSNTQIQYNNAGSFGASAGLTFNYTTNALATTGTFTATCNIAGGNLTTTGAISATGNITGGGHVGTIYTNSIINTGANSTGNIGSSSLYFNTAFVKATSAQYADVAEWYSSDKHYKPGTVVVFGGTEEVTIATQPGDNSVAGVVSTNPAYIMNAGIQSEYAVPVALTGRVPTKVIGPVFKGNMMISAGNGHAIACSTPAVGTVIGKAIENFSGDVGVIEIVVGRV